MNYHNITKDDMNNGDGLRVVQPTKEQFSVCVRKSKRSFQLRLFGFTQDMIGKPS